ncbi:MAG: ATP-binding cassette domain-containing protein [Flavobacteriales bacterium]
MLQKLQHIYAIIPKEYQKKAIRYFLFSIVNIVLDLVSIAYLIPLFIFILDKSKMPQFLKDISFFNESYLVYWVLGIILLFVVKNFIQIAIIRFQSKLVFNIATKISTNLTQAFLSSNYYQIQQLDKGKEIQKIQMSGTDFANHILLSVNTFFTEISVLIVIAVISLILYPYFSIYIFFVAFICLVVIYLFQKQKINKIGQSIRKLYAVSTSHLLNIIDGFLEIKSLGKETFFQKKYEQTLETFNANFADLKNHQNSNGKLLEIAIICILSLFLFYVNSSMAITAGKVLLISYVAGISLKLFPSINKLIIAFTNFKSYQYTLDILLPFEKKEEKKETYTFTNTITLENISFSYKNDFQLFSNVNLTLKKGQIIGLKGRSGIGKTTLLNIIMGMLPPNSGKIKIDNKTVTTIDNSLFNFVGYVPQQPFLFQGSLLENIIMDEEESKTDFKKINQLIAAFYLTEFVSRLPNGLKTVLTHDSLQVSGGQKQRIALIRALYANPQLLILDEVTNQLDEDLEQEILKYIRAYTLQNNIATLLVSHANYMQQICDVTYKIENHNLQKID